MQFVPTLSGEMIRADDYERLAPHEGEPESGNLWNCQTRDGRSHRLTPETVDLMSSTVVPCATGWFVPEELVGDQAMRSSAFRKCRLWPGCFMRAGAVSRR